MQAWLIRFVEQLNEQIASTGGGSINDAISALLPRMTNTALLMVRDAAADLERIVELELQRRDESEVDAFNARVAGVLERICGYCGGKKPEGQSCDCFDNGCQ